jgi:hypothetical protein
MIIVYGGSQADDPDRPSQRLPRHAEKPLIARIRGLLQSLKPRCLVGALASGADILFARAALAEGIALHVTLPFDVDTFRRTSVASPGEVWVDHYDRILDTVRPVIGDLDATDELSYRKHNLVLLDEAERLVASADERVWVISVRPPSDGGSLSVTDDLMLRAEERGLLAIDFDPLPESRTAFIVMSYGRKKEPRVNRYFECDPAFHRIYRPLLEDLDIDWTRADLETDSGIIHSAMLADLANSDIVLVDLSTVGFNVAYELGVRHVFASHSTVLVNPRITAFTRQPPPFDVNMIRIHSYDRGIEAVTDQQAEDAIRSLRPILRHALDHKGIDSPAHEWFELTHISRPFSQRGSIAQPFQRERDIRDDVARAIKSSDAARMNAEADRLAVRTDITDSTRRALRIELAAGLLDEGAHGDARALLDVAKPSVDDRIHRPWLQKSVMAYRRLAETAHDPHEQERLWDVAKQHLREAVDSGYGDSETYGIWGGLLKRQLELRRQQLSQAVAQSLFGEMEAKYRNGFELDPSYYTGVNLVMALRWSGRPRDEVFDRDFNEALTVSRFLARRAVAEDPNDFWARVTLAELTLHEALHRGKPIEQAVREYADAAQYGRPDQIDSARFQLNFLRNCGDNADDIDTVLAALDEVAP